MTRSAPVRLNRFLAMAGVTSRRKADELIAGGRVTVNGRPVTDLGSKVDPAADVVFLDGRQVAAVAPGLYILLNKPKDTITTLSDERGRRSVREFVGIDRRIYPVGRLDRHTTGVLIFTNDGDFANALMHPRNKVRKTYLVTADRAVAPDDLRKLAGGIRLSDGVTAPAEAGTVPGTKQLVVELTIREGRNRQVHRMFEAAGYKVRKLDRVAYGPVTCGGLPRGAWRHLAPGEVRALLSEAGAAGEGTPSRRRSAPSDGRNRRPGGDRGASPVSGRKTGRGKGSSRPSGRPGQSNRKTGRKSPTSPPKHRRFGR